MATRVLWSSDGFSPEAQLIGVVRMSPFGTGESLLTGASQTASLTFFANYMPKARNPVADFKAFATLNGEARLLPDGNVEFTGAKTVTLIESEPSPAANRTVLTLRGGDSRVAIDDVAVPLPSPPADARYLEVGVEFKVGDQTEGTLLQNDRLDLNAFRCLTIKLEDESDNPVPFERYVVIDVDGATLEGFLDDTGSGFVQGLRSAHCRVDFPDVERVEKIAGPEEGP